MKHVLVLLNARAGTLLDMGATRVVDEIKSALQPHCERLDVRLLSPREMRRAIADAAVGRHDTVIIGGGDGSVSAAVAAFSGSDKVLGVLPFGTMNLLARDLGMPTDPRAAVAALAAAVPRRIDLAEINGRPVPHPVRPRILQPHGACAGRGPRSSARTPRRRAARVVSRAAPHRAVQHRRRRSTGGASGSRRSPRSSPATASPPTGAGRGSTRACSKCTSSRIRAR